MSITGHGQASKEQVATMLRTILAFHDKKLLLDATDALGAALCHYYQSGKPASSRNSGGSKSSKSWEEFVRNNSTRVKE
jgi:crossover junction endodeoxyribonuclease RuvC